MLGKGDSDFILEKKKEKKKNKKKQHLTCQKHTDRQNIGTHTQTIKKKLWRRQTDCLSASRHRELKSTATDKTSVFLSGLRK